MVPDRRLLWNRDDDRNARTLWSGMEITCPACAARYDVAERMVLAARAVRCVRCGTTWTPVQAPPAAVAELSAPESAFAPDGRERAMTEASPPQALRDRPGGWPLRLAWLGSLVVVLVAGWSVIHFRHRIAAEWPPSARLYAAVGLRAAAIHP